MRFAFQRARTALISDGIIPKWAARLRHFQPYLQS